MPQTETGEQKTPSRKKVWQMFDRIAPTYDLLNRLLSFRQDVLWRKRMIRYLPEKDNQSVLDLATGTGDMLLEIFRRSDKVGSGMGVDVSEGMLEIGRKKIARKGLQDKVDLQKGDATNLHFAANTFDTVTISFGIRNVMDVQQALSEMHRVLQPGGRVLILEFALPQNPLILRGYLLYFRHILPLVGRLVSGDAYAYRYLNQTVESFPYGEEFCQLLQEAGFEQVHYHTLPLGIAMIYQGDKPLAA